MATAPQYLYGSTRPVMAAFDTADTTITFSVGDLVILASGKINVIGSGTVTTNFLGVTAQKKATGITGTALRLFGNAEDGTLRVDTDGEWIFDCDDTMALNVGDLVAPNGTQKVAKTATSSISLGVVTKAMAASAGRVQIKIQSGAVPQGRIS